MPIIPRDDGGGRAAALVEGDGDLQVSCLNFHNNVHVYKIHLSATHEHFLLQW